MALPRATTRSSGIIILAVVALVSVYNLASFDGDVNGSFVDERARRLDIVDINDNVVVDFKTPRRLIFTDINYDNDALTDDATGVQCSLMHGVTTTSVQSNLTVSEFYQHAGKAGKCWHNFVGSRSAIRAPVTFFHVGKGRDQLHSLRDISFLSLTNHSISSWSYIV